MQQRIRNFSAVIAAAATLSVAACGHGGNQRSAAGNVGTPAAVAPTDSASSTATPYSNPTASSTTMAPADTAPAMKHHSKLAGALVGAAAGHMLGHHALAGAAVGAMVQHERNKHEKP